MTSLAARAALALLTVVLALFFATPATATQSYSLLTGVSGSSYFWQLVQDALIANPALIKVFNNAVESDLQAAAGTDVTVTYKGLLINASAMYLRYDAGVAASTPSEVTVQARVATATFPALSGLVDLVKTQVAAFSDIIPTALAATNPLPISPTGDDTSSGYTFTGSVSYDVVVMFSGAPAAWATTLASSRTTVAANIVASVQALLNSSMQENAVTVSEMYVLAADSKYKTMGSGMGGLVASLHVVCYGTTAMAGRYLSTSEYASVLMLLDTASLMATYQSASGSSEIVVVEDTTSAAALKVHKVCGNTCKGMIAMAAVVVGLSLVCLLIAAIAVCCPCCYIRTRQVAQTERRAEPYSGDSVVEAIDVCGDNRYNERHEPTTEATGHHMSKEPAME